MVGFLKGKEVEISETMTAKEVAALFGKSITTIYSWRDKKQNIQRKRF